MRAQTGALDFTACEEQLPLPEGVASTAGPFRGMPNIERELSAWLDNVERCRHCSTPQWSISPRARPRLELSLEKIRGVDLVDET